MTTDPAPHVVLLGMKVPEAAWVHAHLHRIEGDLAHASCWYGKAGRKVPGDDVETERNSITAELLRSSV